ncbi:hypothetical protein GCM10027430_26860 [Lysobacter tyrosinilyticus]
MTATREEIEAEVATLAEGKSLPPHARPSLTALLQHKNNLPIDQACPYCGQTLWVEDHGTAWTIKCPCGKSDNSWRGL